MTLRKRLYLTLEPTEKGGIIEAIFEFVLVIIIILNILSIVFDSVQDVHLEYGYIFKKVELYSVMFFTIEYIARLYSIVESPKYKGDIKGRLKYIGSTLAIIDLLAFLPFYLTFLPFDLRFLRIFRLMALFRMFKIARYLHALSVFKKVLIDRKEQLVISFIFIAFILVCISFAMFYAEHDAQPAKFSSIPATMWWGVSTLTTVGYGDIVPITTLGKFLGGLFSIAGIGIIALPTGILSSGFYEIMHNHNRKITCPHCGKDFHD
ncbi:MAG TPA: ion transporter [Cyclobacteriaceae bacterium]|jgi:voltage-gated potassium channel|nr:ion transporter [Cyclobacteriaceae bacterium]